MQERWTVQIDDITNYFKHAFGEMTVSELNWKPDPKTWSIAQNIDHLMVINRSYYPVIKSVREGSYKVPLLGKLGFVVSFMGRTLLKSMQPDRRTRMKTFSIWEPSKSDLPPDILQRFEKHQQELKELIVSCGDLLDRGTVISSPANKNIVYTLEAAFDIIVTHERRHFEQAMEVERMRPR